MKYLFILATVLALAACGNDSETDNAATESSGEAISDAMAEKTPKVMDAAKDAGGATMADMAETMGSTIDDAKSAVAELEKAAMGSAEDAEMAMGKAKELMGE